MACLGCNLSALKANPLLNDFVSRVSAMVYSKGMSLIVNSVSESEPEILQRVKIGTQNAKGMGEVTTAFAEVVNNALGKFTENELSFDSKTGILSVKSPKKETPIAEVPKLKAKLDTPMLPNGEAV